MVENWPNGGDFHWQAYIRRNVTENAVIYFGHSVTKWHEIRNIERRGKLAVAAIIFTPPPLTDKGGHDMYLEKRAKK